MVAKKLGFDTVGLLPVVRFNEKRYVDKPEIIVHLNGNIRDDVGKIALKLVSSNEAL